MSSTVDEAVEALRGRPARDRSDRHRLRPRGEPDSEAAVRLLSRAKGRDDGAADRARRRRLDVPPRARPGAARPRRGRSPARSCPGPYTLVLPQPSASLPPAGRLAAGDDRRPGSRARRARSRGSSSSLGAVRCDEREPHRRSRSAHPRGGAGRARVGPRPPWSTAVACPGTASTVLDFTGAEPRVLREGAAPGGRRAPDRRVSRSSIGGDLVEGAQMAVAQHSLDQLRTAGLADVDPEIAALLGRELERQRDADRADRLRELHLAERARGGRLRADEQVRGGLSRQALLRRLRGRRRDRAARDRPREGAVRRRARERAAARGRAGEHGRLLRACSRPATRSSRSGSTTAAT